MKQHYVMPVGVDDFRRVREQYYYVDKTDFIKALIDGHAQATLITRPRRFGKTLSMSMLYYFFTLEDAMDHRALFEGSKIEKAGERYMAEQGTRPVVFLSLKDIRESSFEDMLAGFACLMSQGADSGLSPVRNVYRRAHYAQRPPAFPCKRPLHESDKMRLPWEF